MNKDIKISITEKQILHYIIDTPSLLETLSIEFVTDIANSYFNLLLELYKNKLSFIPEHIFKVKNNDITTETYDAILETNYQSDKLEEYISEINEYKLYKKLESKVLKESLFELGKSDSDIEKLKSYYNQFGDILKNIEKKDDKKEYLTFHDLIEEHELIVEDRSKKIHQTTGCPNFDKILPTIIPGIILIVGYSGSAKSTLLHYFQRQRIIKRLPTISVNTELSKIGFNDGILPSFLKVNYYDLLGIDNEDNIDYSDILNRMKILKNKYTNKNNYLYFNDYSCTVKKLEKMIIHSREYMNMDKRTTLFCFVDLFSMLEEFNKSESGYNKSDVINKYVDYVNEIALTHNVLVIGTVQLKRPEEKSMIVRLDDLDKFKPNVSSIKSSGSWEERARMILTIHNPWAIAHRNNCKPIIRDMIDPIVYLTVGKDSYFQNTGKEIQYLYQAEYKTFIPYEEQEKEEE